MSIYNTSLRDIYRPTFFELIAADRLVPGLKPAFTYLLHALARNTHTAKISHYSDELFLLSHLLLEKNYLFASHSTFSENFYALKRVRLVEPAGAIGDFDNSVPFIYGHDAPIIDSTYTSLDALVSDRPLLVRLTDRDCWLSLIGTVVIPYVKSKIDAKFIAMRDGITSDGFQEFNDPVDGSDSSSVDGSARQSLLASMKKVTLRAAFLRVWPIIHALSELLALYYQCRYLFDRSPHYSPLFQLLGITVRRMNADDLQSSSSKSLSSSQSLTSVWYRAQYGTVIGAVLDSVRSLLSSLSSSAKYLILFGLLGFKVIDWLNASSANTSSSQPQAPVIHTSQTAPLVSLPIPAAPAPLPPAPSSTVALPSNSEICPLCQRDRTNAAAASSGYVYCYPCLFAYVDQHEQCPITHLPCTVKQIRKIYDT